VGVVVSRTYSNLACASVGSNGKWATAPLTLHAPVGHRLVVRATDRAPLPVFAIAVTLRCQDAIASVASPDADQTVLFNEVALPKESLQANRSGESDSSAKLFAKFGLAVASGATLRLAVPDQWMDRASIGWGSPAVRALAVYVQACPKPSSGNRWLIFAGGFWVPEVACIPVGVNSGSQRETVQVGVGTACPGQAPPPSGI
jgi:hypothetical protein